MLSHDGKKKVAALIVAGMPGPGHEDNRGKSYGTENEDEDMHDGPQDDEDGEDGDGKSAAEESAFADLREALTKSKDDKAGVAALHEFLELCGYKREE